MRVRESVREYVCGVMVVSEVSEYTQNNLPVSFFHSVLWTFIMLVAFDFMYLWIGYPIALFISVLWWVVALKPLSTKQLQIMRMAAMKSKHVAPSWSPQGMRLAVFDGKTTL